MTSQLGLRHLRCFIALAEENHFGRAAERLGITQPALTQQIRRLEEITGCRLVRRRPRVALTEAGEAFFVRARRSLADADAAVDIARRTSRGERGLLTLGVVPSTLLVPELPRAIRRFRETHPEVELRIREMSTTEQLEALRLERIDLGLLREAPADSEIASKVVVRERFVAVLPAGHHLATAEPFPLASLASEPFVLFGKSLNPPFYTRVVDLCRAAGFFPRVVQEAPEVQSRVSLVEAGLGVTIAPACIQRFCGQDIVYRTLDMPEAFTTIALCWRRRDRSPKVEAFLDVLMGQHEQPVPST